MHHNLLRNDAAAFESVERLMTLGTNMWQRYGESMASLAAGFVSGDSVKELVKQIDGTE